MVAENMPIDILRVRDDDIPGLVMDGVVDLQHYRRERAGRRGYSIAARRANRAILPCAVLTSAAAVIAGNAVDETGTARRWTANVSLPVSAHSSNATRPERRLF